MSHKQIETNEKSNLQSTYAAGFTKPNIMDNINAVQFKDNQTLTSKASRNKSRERVTYWAGMRIEGAMTPFERKEDELYKWNMGIANGQLFEKIGGPRNGK